MKFMMETQFGVRKVYRETTEYTKREIVADFVAGPEGDFAYNCFCEGLSRKRGTLREMGTGIYLIGNLDQLLGVSS